MAKTPISPRSGLLGYFVLALGLAAAVGAFTLPWVHNSGSRIGLAELPEWTTGYGVLMGLVVGLATPGVLRMVPQPGLLDPLCAAAAAAAGIAAVLGARAALDFTKVFTDLAPMAGGIYVLPGAAVAVVAPLLIAAGSHLCSRHAVEQAVRPRPAAAQRAAVN
jgi:hypothetical protein